MMNKEQIDKMLDGVRHELEIARTVTFGFKRGIKDASTPYDMYPTFEPTDQMTITIEINKPDDNDRQDRRLEQRGDGKSVKADFSKSAR